MRLLMCFSDGDQCTWSADSVLPIEYESAEAALVDFETTCIAAVNDDNWRHAGEFVFCGHTLNTNTFWFTDRMCNPKDRPPHAFYPPDFFTIDEFFEARKGTA
jgi:hypothetical protein